MRVCSYDWRRCRDAVDGDRDALFMLLTIRLLNEDLSSELEVPACNPTKPAALPELNHRPNVTSERLLS